MRLADGGASASEGDGFAANVANVALFGSCALTAETAATVFTQFSGAAKPSMLCDIVPLKQQFTRLPLVLLYIVQA